MNKQYHILNGDSLKEQFPKNLKGQTIIARECLVDGNVKSDSLEDFFQVRAKFIADFYGNYSIQDYYNESASQFEKIKEIPKGSIINLWFEDDLFCQVNYWFVVYLLYNYVKESKVFLIRPTTHTQFGFGGLNKDQLLKVFEEKIQIVEIDKISSLWESYQNDDQESLISTANELKASFPYILHAVEAHIARIPTKDNPGRPKQSLINIMNDLETNEFVPVFREFNKRESIYGFGDLQVKRLFDEIKSNR